MVFVQLASSIAERRFIEVVFVAKKTGSRYAPYFHPPTTISWIMRDDLTLDRKYLNLIRCIRSRSKFYANHKKNRIWVRLNMHVRQITVNL